MAEASVSRSLRSGTADGEQATAVMISSSVSSTSGSRIFRHFVDSLMDSIASGAAQAKAMVVLAACACPETYASSGSGKLKASSLQVLDCFSDPLGWEALLSPKKVVQKNNVLDIRDLNALLLAISEAGKKLLGSNSHERFAVAIDSLSLLLRHHSLGAVTKFLSHLRALESVSAIIWFTNSIQPRVIDSLQYLATVSMFVEPQPEILHNDDCETGRIRVRQKRRTGVIRKEVEEFKVEYNSLKFSPIQVGASNDAGNVHQVQFRLELSEKELEDRSKVVLPFEHQGNGKESEIYDGRKQNSSANETTTGNVHYLRDSDDEYVDSDEDPDDDLDI